MCYVEINMRIDLFNEIKRRKKLFALYFRNMFILLNLNTSTSFFNVKCIAAMYGFIYTISETECCFW